MSNELERLKTELIAAEVEIARLNEGLVQLKEKARFFKYCPLECDYDRGFSRASSLILDKINDMIYNQ